jgi:hypothetical protein
MTIGDRGLIFGLIERYFIKLMTHGALTGGHFSKTVGDFIEHTFLKSTVPFINLPITLAYIITLRHV